MSREHQIVAKNSEQKLAFEQEHLDALHRMRILEPYYRWTLRLMQPYIGRRVMDAGCGIGNFTQLLAQKADYVLAVDLSPRNVEVVRERFRNGSVVEPLQADLEDDVVSIASKNIDTIVCLDVLEHVRDDLGLLRSFRQVIQPGGSLLVKVPACPWLYGSIDIASSHYRRYTKRKLADKALQAGWQPVRAFYMNIFGMLPYWWKGRVTKRSMNFSRTFSPWQIGVIRRVIPLLQAIDTFIGPPVGQSAVLVAK